MSTRAILIGVGGVLAAGVVLSACGGSMLVGLYNQPVPLATNVDRAWADVEAQYQRRTDLVPQIVAVVKGAARFEQETLTAVTQARASATQMRLSADDLQDPEKVKAFQAAQGSLGGALSRLMVASENYPQLQASAQFRDLSEQIEGTQNRITLSVTRFNESVMSLNNCVETIPCSFGASMHGYGHHASFEAEAGAKANPVVDFAGGAK